MSNYKGYLFNIVTDKGSSILIEDTGYHLKVTATMNTMEDVHLFNNMDDFQNTINLFVFNSEKDLTNEEIVDKLSWKLITTHTEKMIEVSL